MGEMTGGHLQNRVVGVALVLLIAAPVQAAKWYVANNGVDGTGCGTTKGTPCRSVSKAISVAASGDIIIVGPGVYGDLDHSGTFGDFPGEEAAEVGSGCECMIKVDKPLTIQSRDGGYVTILDARGLTNSVVHILGPDANGTVFGKLNKGFTITNGITAGVLTDPVLSQKVTVQGNVATGNVTGFDIAGDGGTGTGNAMVVKNNIAVGNTNGFSLNGDFNVMQGNRAVSNTDKGFILDGHGHTFKQNVAVQNAKGINPEVSSVAGLFWTGKGTKNAAIGNSTAGVFVDVTAQATVFMDKSNLYGNGDPANNCGLAVDNESASGTSTIGFSGNYWGVPTGAGPTNPADNGGAAATLCNTGPGSNAFGAVDAANSSATEVTVTEKALK
jgi:hypothetical protein